MKHFLSMSDYVLRVYAGRIVHVHRKYKINYGAWSSSINYPLTNNIQLVTIIGTMISRTNCTKLRVVTRLVSLEKKNYTYSSNRIKHFLRIEVPI